jgi:hypothetical protein
MPPSSDAAKVLVRLDRIQDLIDKLVTCRDDVIQQQNLAERIHREILAAKQALWPVD